LVSAYKNQINNPRASQILQYSLPNGEFGYYVLDQNGNLIKKQMVGAAVSGGLDLSTKGGKQSYASTVASELLSSYLKASSINLIKQEAQRAVENANKIYGTNFRVEDFIQEVKDNRGNVVDIDIKDTPYIASPKMSKAIEQVKSAITSTINNITSHKLTPDEAFGVYNEIFTRYLNPQGISSVDNEAKIGVLSQIANFVDFNTTPQTTGGKILKTELLNTFKGIGDILQEPVIQQKK
jgi:hypothetical protein